MFEIEHTNVYHRETERRDRGAMAWKLALTKVREKRHATNTFNSSLLFEWRLDHMKLLGGRQITF
jgi:hypothetical protein